MNSINKRKVQKLVLVKMRDVACKELFRVTVFFIPLRVRHMIWSEERRENYFNVLQKQIDSCNKPVTIGLTIINDGRY